MQQLSFAEEIRYDDDGALIFQSTVYFAKQPNLPRNLRRALIDYDNLLYLSDYNA